MSTTLSHCPLCYSSDVVPMGPDDLGALQQGYEESFVADFECKKCHRRFRYTPSTLKVPEDREPWP